jgi:hypothetical protein
VLDLDVPGLAELQSSVVVSWHLSSFHSALQYIVSHRTVIFLIYRQVSLQMFYFLPVDTLLPGFFLASMRV